MLELKFFSKKLIPQLTAIVLAITLSPIASFAEEEICVEEIVSEIVAEIEEANGVCEVSYVYCYEPDSLVSRNSREYTEYRAYSPYQRPGDSALSTILHIFVGASQVAGSQGFQEFQQQCHQTFTEIGNKMLQDESLSLKSP